MVFLCSDQWITVLMCWCVGVLLGLLMRKGYGMNGFEWPTYENKDQLYNDSSGTFLGELLSVIESRNERVVFVVELIDLKLNEKYLIWQFRSNSDNWGFGFAWVLTNIKERLSMKHLVQVQAYIETDETDLKRIGLLGLQKIKEEIASGFVVVDVFERCINREMYCVNVSDLSKVGIADASKKS